MTLPIETAAVGDQYARRALDLIAQQFPIPRVRDATFQANGTNQGAALADSTLVTEAITFTGGQRLEVRGTVRMGGNTAGAVMTAAIFMDGADTGIRGNAIAQGAGVYLAMPLCGWLTPAAGAHTFKLFGSVTAGLANCDAAVPSFVSFQSR